MPITHDALEGMKKEVEEAFDKGFVFEGLNAGPSDAVLLMYRVNADGSRSLATRPYVLAFINQAIDSRLSWLEGEVGKMKDFPAEMFHIHGGKMPFVIFGGKADEDEKFTIYRMAYVEACNHFISRLRGNEK